MAQDPATKPTDEPSATDAREAARGSGDRSPALPRLAPEEPRLELGTLLAPEREKPTVLAEPRTEPRRPSVSRATAPTAHAAFLARRHFGSLDGLRALGILAVVWHHTMGGPGRFGANLFFLLSGFLITTILLRERAKKGSIDVARFRTRRARRLYPLYFAVLASYVAIVWVMEPVGPSRSAFFRHLPAFASFTSNLFVGLDGEHVIFYFAWSLAAQEQFYLWWPAYLKHLTPRVCGGALVSLLLTSYLTRTGWLDLALPPGSLMRTLALSLMPALSIGALLGLALNRRASFDAMNRLLGSRWASVAALSLALVLWRMPGAPEPLMHLVLTALAAACVLRENHWLALVLRQPWLVHIGTVSYGIYLLHMLCHNLVERVLGRLGAGAGVLDFALTALLAVALASLSHRHFEDRFLPADKRAKPA